MLRLIGHTLFVIIGSFVIALVFYQKLGVFKENVKPLPILNYCMDSSDYNDIIFIGNSRVAYHINPMIIDSIDNIKSYDVAIDGSRIIENNLLLNEYLLNHPKPQAVFVTIDYNMFGTNGVPNDITNYFSYLGNPSVFHYLSPYKLAYRYKVIQYFYFIQKIFALPDGERKTRLLTSLFNYSAPAQNQTVFYRGFMPLKRGWGTRAENELKTVKSKISYQSLGLSLLKTMADRCRQDSINVIFLVPPAYCEIGTKFLNEAEEINRVKADVAKYNVPIWDYRTMNICKSKNYFYDFLHLNQKGAAIYSRQLALDIEEKLHITGSTPPVNVKSK